MDVIAEGIAGLSLGKENTLQEKPASGLIGPAVLRPSGGGGGASGGRPAAQARREAVGPHQQPIKGGGTGIGPQRRPAGFHTPPKAGEGAARPDGQQKGRSRSRGQKNRGAKKNRSKCASASNGRSDVTTSPAHPKAADAGPDDLADVLAGLKVGGEARASASPSPSAATAAAAAAKPGAGGGKRTPRRKRGKKHGQRVAGAKSGVPGRSGSPSVEPTWGDEVDAVGANVAGPHRDPAKRVTRLGSGPPEASPKAPEAGQQTGGGGGGDEGPVPVEPTTGSNWRDKLRAWGAGFEFDAEQGPLGTRAHHNRGQHRAARKDLEADKLQRPQPPTKGPWGDHRTPRARAGGTRERFAWDTPSSSFGARAGGAAGDQQPGADFSSTKPGPTQRPQQREKDPGRMVDLVLGLTVSPSAVHMRARGEHPCCMPTGAFS